MLKVRNVIITVSFLVVLAAVGLAYNPTHKAKPGDVIITDFEFEPNNLGGKVACYGAVGRKDAGTWSYSGYTDEESYSGKKSYRLVFTKHSVWTPEQDEDFEQNPFGIKRTKSLTRIGQSDDINWAVFMVDLGPVEDTSKTPVKIQHMDISKFKYLVFWVKGGSGGEKFKIYFRDTHARNYDPQIKIKPGKKIGIQWQPISIDLQDRKLMLKVDLTKIVQVGIGFGKPDGGKPGNVMYVDNFMLVK